MRAHCAARNQPARVESISFTMHRMRDGKIAERWYMANHLELMREIGLLPEGS